VLRRHAETERNRELGLPPTDSVLRRHYAHLLATLQSVAAPTVGAAAAAPRASTQVQPQHAARASAPAAAGGGVIGWFRRLLGV
jgi:hypothetical protein